MGTRPYRVTVTMPLSDAVGRRGWDAVMAQAIEQVPDVGYVRGKTVQHVVCRDSFTYGSSVWGVKALCGLGIYAHEMDSLSHRKHRGWSLCKACEKKTNP